MNKLNYIKSSLILLFMSASFTGWTQTPVYLYKTISPSVTYKEFVNDDIKTHGSDGYCNSGDEIKIAVTDPLFMASSVTTDRLGNGRQQSRVKVNIKWNACIQGIMYVQVYYRSRLKSSGINFRCHWTSWTYMYTYKITRKNESPGGDISGVKVMENSDPQGYTNFTLYYLPGSGYKGFPNAKTIRYINTSDGTVKTEVPLNKDGSGYLKTAITFKAKGFGNFTFKTEILDDCQYYRGPTVTVSVLPTCYKDNPKNVTFSVNVPSERVFDEGYLVDANKNYTLSSSNATDPSVNYFWKIDALQSSSDGAVLDNNSFRILDELGSYGITLAVKPDRKEWCKVPTITKMVFVGGRNHTFEDQCTVELPKDFSKLGFPGIDLNNIILKHFEGTVKSQRSIVVMPGITLEDGAELTLETTPGSATTDLKMNFTEQTTFDEYGRVLGAGRSYFGNDGKSLQAQYKNISREVILANATLYDAYGRPAISTLSAPVKSGTTNTSQCPGETEDGVDLDFGYKADFVKTTTNEVYGYSHFDLNNELHPMAVDGTTEGTLGWYYSSRNGTSTDQKLNEPLVATTQYPYSRTLFKHDGSGDVKSVTKPGDVFKAGSPYLGTSDPEIIDAADSYLNDYFTMRDKELKLAKPSSIVGEFLKTIVTDGSDKQSITYTDKGGKSIITVTKDEHGDQTSKSYQFYDNAGRLLVSVSPNGLNQYNKNNFASIDKTSYFYNNRGLLFATEETDAGRTEYVYRRDGKIRFSQNAEQRKAQRFSYTNYDAVGRPTESGEYAFAPGGVEFNSQAMRDILENTSPDGGISEIIGNKSERTFSYYDEPNSTLRTQRFVQGAVSYSKKNNAITTWYSYDERGRVEWTIQDITGLGVKTLDYRYGPTGQVQEVTYQKGKSDQFVHYYEYDQDGRLFKAYTSPLGLEYDKLGKLVNPGVLELQATYFYYLHGPLKRIELAGKLQGIDYLYTADGALKAINHADPANDPGGDGAGNGFTPDVFGMTLDYYAGDYNGANFKGGTLTTTDDQNVDQFTGLIKANRWHGPVEPGKQFGYTYHYDNRNQFKQANWGGVVTNASTKASVLTVTPLFPYKEAVGDYDDNGNIMSMQRNATLNRLNVDNLNISIADFTYHYKPFTNMLQNITQPNGNGGTETFRAYGYNDLGQMTEETEGDQSKFVVYDVTGKVTAVYADAGHTKPITTFEYDDRGFRLNKTTFNEVYAALLRIWYVRDASGNMISTYEDDLTNADPAKPTEVPVYGSGKIGLYKPEYGYTFYELTDHLGNVRAVIGNDLNITYAATMESELRVKETSDGFVNLNSDGLALFNTTKSGVVGEVTVTGDETYKVNNKPTEANNFTKNPVGVGKMLWVHPGDKIKAEVQAKYVNFNKNNTNVLVGLAGFLTKVFKDAPVIDGISIFNVMNSADAVALAAASPLDEDQPRAFLNYILFDKNFKLQDVKSVQVTSAAEFTETNPNPERLSFENIDVEKEGFIYFYVSSMSDQGMEVYFDDFTITHAYSNIVAGGDFYPYGLAIKDRQIDREKYRFGYQGQYAEKDEETGWNHFELREYDPVIGRWTSIDPYGQYYSPYVGMGNEPISSVDKDGGCVDAKGRSIPCPDGISEIGNKDLVVLEGVMVIADETFDFKPIPMPKDAVRDIFLRDPRIGISSDFQFGGLYGYSSSNDGNDHTGDYKYKQKGQGEAVDVALFGLTKVLDDDRPGIMENKRPKTTPGKKDSIIVMTTHDPSKYYTTRPDGTLGTPFYQSTTVTYNVTKRDTISKTTHRQYSK